ncbi:MAG: histidine phosphatase family protein [Chthoniobacterales bacterium]
MQLFFLRHAEAEDVAPSDSARRLTKKGELQSKVVGEFCVRAGNVPDLIVTSPLARAERTARIFSETAGGVDVVVERWMASGMSADEFFDGLGAYRSTERVMVVGHEPDLSEAISAAIGSSTGAAVQVRKASLTVVNLRTIRPGGGRIDFCLPVRLMTERGENL